MYRLLESVAEGCDGHGPVHLLVNSAAEIMFQWDSHRLGCERRCLPVLSNLAGPIQHFWSAVLEAWKSKVAADLCVRKGFRGARGWMVHGTLQLLNSDHVRERDKALLRGVHVGGGWKWVSVGEGESLCRAGSAVVLMVMVIFSGIVLFLLWLGSVNILSFMIS